MQAYSATAFDQVVVVPTANPETGDYDGEWWQTVVRLSFVIDGEPFSIDPGYITNFGSIPKIARSIVDQADESLLGFIGHDFLYGDDNPTEYSKEEADEFLFVVSLSNGQDFFEAWFTRKAVTWFGDKHYKRSGNNFAPVAKELIAKICADNNYFPVPLDDIGMIQASATQG
jgi:hypothetical protein